MSLIEVPRQYLENEENMQLFYYNGQWFTWQIEDLGGAIYSNVTSASESQARGISKREALY